MRRRSLHVPIRPNEPFAEDDGELGLGLEPFARRPFPFVSRPSNLTKMPTARPTLTGKTPKPRVLHPVPLLLTTPAGDKWYAT